MSSEIQWGGINGKSLCKALVSDIWIVFAAMVITYLGLGIAENMRNTPSYTSSAVVAVYPFNQMYTLEASSSALETVGTVNEVFNSEMFRTGLEARLAEPADYSLYSSQISGTSILMLSVSSSSPEKAYQILRAAIDYYEEISSHLVGESSLEILTDPDFPTTSYIDSKILKYRFLLTLVMGFAAAAFLVLIYAMRKTYKTAAALRRYHKNVRFFRIASSASDKRSRSKKGRYESLKNQETTRVTVLELWQTLRAKKSSSVFITSASHDEGKTDVTVSLAKELAALGKSVLILETDPDNIDISKQLNVSDNQSWYTLSELAQDVTLLDSSATDITDQNIKVLFTEMIDSEYDLRSMTINVERILKQAETIADVVLVEGCIWIGTEEEWILKKAADTSLAVCGQDKANFYAVDRMMMDLQETDSDFLGCVLYGF